MRKQLAQEGEGGEMRGNLVTRQNTVLCSSKCMGYNACSNPSLLLQGWVTLTKLFVLPMPLSVKQG